MFRKLEIYLRTVRTKHRWIRPVDGYDTGASVYNCIVRDKVPLVVKNKDLVSWYTCGPTVYDSAHLGHASCYVKLDTIQRILRHYYHLNLVTVMNITDIDDKLIKRSRELRVSVETLAKQYEMEFWKDMTSLGIDRPNHVIRVTENVDVIIDFVQSLLDKKVAYRAADDSVYFNVDQCENYGKLSHLSDPMNETSSAYKRNQADFALWKSSSDDVSWPSPWGRGRPGWHIECSALASQIFGSNIDIHCGGIDLKFPHHENEEAQSCAHHSCSQWVNYWIHVGHLHASDAVKMSKSLKNTISIAQLLKTTPANTFRMACLMSHYSSPMEFSTEFMATAANTLNRYYNFMETCANYAKNILRVDIDSGVVNGLLTETSQKITNSLKDDFNTPLLISSLNEFVTAMNVLFHSGSTTMTDKSNLEVAPVLAAANLLCSNLRMLGIMNSQTRESGDSFVEIMDIFNVFRQEVRQLGIATNNIDVLKLCDQARTDLKNNGISVRDYGKKSSWSVGIKA